MTKDQRGELGLTLAIVSLVVMFLGSLAGNNLSNQAVKKSSLARGSVQCGQYGCKNNSDCAQNVGFTVLCHVSSGQCRPSDPRNSCAGGTPRVDKVKRDVGQPCSSDGDCKTGLYCSSVTRVCMSNVRPTSQPAPTSSSGGNFPAGSCVFAPTAYVKLRSGNLDVPFSSELDSNVTNWSVVNNVGGTPLRFGSSGSSASGGSVVGDYCCGTQNNADGLGLGRTYRVDKTAPYGDLAGSRATVTLSGFDTTKYRVVGTEGPGTNVSSATISNLPVGCLAYSYGWVLECTGSSCPQPNIPQPTNSDITRYRTIPGICEMTFMNVDDPRITRITIGQRGQAVLFDTDNQKNGCLPFNSPNKGDTIYVNYDPNKQSNVEIRARSSGSSGATKICSFDRQGLVNGVEAYPMVVTMYYQVQKGPIGQRVWYDYNQPANTNGGCVAFTTPQVTQTSSPTPSPTIRITPTATRTATPTTTVSPTLTLTPTATPTNSPTPTSCNTSIYFMIDNSSTQRANISDITSVLNNYFDDHPDDRVSISYDTFNRQVDRGGSGVNTIDFVIPEKRWTNINAAFDRLRSNNAEIKVFISDGVPSVLDASGVPGNRCTYSVNGSRLNGCDPLERNDSTARECDPSRNFTCLNDCKRVHPDIVNKCSQPYPISTSNANHNVVVGGNEGAIATNVARAGGRQHLSLDGFINELPDIIDNACERGRYAITNNKPVNVGMSMRLQNNSTDKTISSLSLQICEDGTSNCQEELVQQSVAPNNSVISNKSYLSLGGSPVAYKNNYSINCNVSYSDGQSEQCGARTIAGIDGGIRYTVNVNEAGVSSESQTFLEASDLNSDKCVNVLDYAMLIKQLSQVEGQEIEDRFDLVLGDGINASDISVMIENLGKPCAE